MKRYPLATLTALLAAASLASAGTPAAKAPVAPPPAETADCCLHNLAPAGVMFEHAHPAGEWMVGYRFNWSHYEGMRHGDNGISNESVFHMTSPAGHPHAATPLEMDMYMHMWEVMHAPADWLTLMVMPQYMVMDMTMLRGGDHEMGGMTGGHGHGHAGSGTHSHDTSGWGDTIASATFKLWSRDHHSLLLTAGMSFPTGSVDEGSGGTFTHYGMQLGSGTFDLLPSVTYLGHAGRLSWGLQYAGTVRLEDENDSGFRFGDAHGVSGWAGVQLCDWASITGRAAYRHEGPIHGHYNGPHNHMSPPDFQGNYGGDTLDLGVGLNFFANSGPLKGNRLAVELLFPVVQDLNGVQVERDHTLAVTWQWSF